MPQKGAPALPQSGPVDAAPEKSILRFLTCGSVDDGKSTLIGRLLYDSHLIADDTAAALERDSRTYGTTGSGTDYALLVDGLQAEREQGITIDVAYRYFATPKRKFIVADTPGHEQYTRNMATGASCSDLAVILVDARKGLLMQTHRHSCIVKLLGIRHIVLAVNKMDLIDYDEASFNAITEQFKIFAQSLGLGEVTPIPLSAAKGDNVTLPSTNMPWYQGPALLSQLETIDVASGPAEAEFRLPVQWVCRPNLDFRGFAGTISSGTLNRGDDVVVLPSARTSKVVRITTADGDLDCAAHGKAIMVTLADEIDVSRGDVFCKTESRAEVADQFQANLIWMSEAHLLKGRPYIIRMGTQSAIAQISDLKYKLNVETLEHVAAKDLGLNEIGVVNVSLSKPFVIDHYEDYRGTGSFILIDRITNATVGAGMVQFALRRAHNIHWQSVDISKKQRAEAKGQQACCLWFTGLSGSGKSTIANLLEKRLFALGRHTYILDGDNVRHGLNRDLGFTDADRVENIRRVSDVARLMVDAGLITLVSFISPFRAERRLARERFETGEFLEIFIDTPLDICESRDAKGLYKKARAGQIANFTGITSPYETPERPEVHLSAGSYQPEALVEQILEDLSKRGIV